MDDASLADYLTGGRTGLREVDQLLSQLPHLRSLTFEVTDSNARLHEFVRLFTQIGLERVHLRTCSEAHKRVNAARERRLSVNGPVKPTLPEWTRKECTRTRTEL